MMITPHDILSSGGKYPERLDDPECVLGVRINAADLAERVSKLLGALNLTARVSSGFRTQAANTLSRGSKNSAHLTGRAVDLEDSDGSLARIITPGLLTQFDLYMENPQFCKGWVHLTTRAPKSGSRIFNP